MENIILIYACDQVAMTSSVSLVAPDCEAPPKALSGRKELAAILVLAVLGRALFWFKRPPDMEIFLEPWFRHILHYGPIQAFAHPFSNYEPAYLYLLAIGSLAYGPLSIMSIIKIISVAGAIFLTFGLAEVLKGVGVDRRAALLLLILPSVMINDTLLAQCDAIWAGACAFALAAMMRGRTLQAMIWCGIAISFKALAAFIAPVMIGAMIGRRAPLWQWLVPALVFLASLVPPFLLGWPLMKLLTVYHGQASFDQIAGRLANPWMLGTLFAEQASHQLFAIGYAAAGAAAVVMGVLAARGARDPRLLILLSALAGTAFPFLLPKMLERYYFLGDIMTLALALSLNTRHASIAVRAVQLASILSHMTYLYFFKHPYPALAGALCAGLGIVVMCQLAAPAFRALVGDLKATYAKRRAVVGGGTSSSSQPSLKNF